MIYPITYQKVLKQNELTRWWQGIKFKLGQLAICLANNAQKMPLLMSIVPRLSKFSRKNKQILEFSCVQARKRSMRGTDYSSRDKQGEVAFYVLLWKRKGISLELFDNYWKDVHGPVCARLPGQYQYWQLHVAHNEGGNWAMPDDPVNSSIPEEQFDGIAELTFKSTADRQTWFEAAGILMDDEHNIFSKAIGYNSNPGNSLTYVDKIPNGTPNGAVGVDKYHCLVRKGDGVSVDEFRQYMKEKFARVIAKSDRVLKCRLHLFEEVDNSRPDAGGVSHIEPPELHYNAAVEVAFANQLEKELFLESSEYQALAGELPKYIKHFKPFPERTAYTFVYDGQITLAGQRSAAVADLIMKIGAANQVKDNITALMVGNVSHGGNTAEKLPGTNADLVKALFARGEAFDSEGFVSFFTETPVYQFGNYPICFDLGSIKESVTAFFGQVLALYHDIKMLWEIGNVVFVEMDVTYWRKDGSNVTLPCSDIVRFEGDKIAELRIFMDANPVGDASIAVSETASVMTMSQRKRMQSADVMKKFFAEHPEGQQRVATGYVPKWSIAGPKWSFNSTSYFTNGLVSNAQGSSTEKLPGSNAHLVKALFARGEAFDSEGFQSFFTDTPVYQFGNFPVCFEREAIKQSVAAFFSQVSALYHDIKMLWETGDVVFVEMDVTYWRKDGSNVTLPCFDIVRFQGDKIAELRIFMDANPIGNLSIPVSDTTSVMFISQKQKLKSTDIMKKFFTEETAGQQRVAMGYTPKWSIAGPQWQIETSNNNSYDSSVTAKSETINWDKVKNYLRGLKFEQLIELMTTETKK